MYFHPLPKILKGICFCSCWLCVDVAFFSFSFLSVCVDVAFFSFSFLSVCVAAAHFCASSLESESEYLLSQYKFTRKYVLHCTVGNRINNRLIF